MKGSCTLSRTSSPHLSPQVSAPTSAKTHKVMICESLGLGIMRVSLKLWWLRQERICLQCRRHRFKPWVRKIPQRRSWQPTPVFLPGEFHGQRSLVGYSPWGRKKSDMIEQLTLWTKLLNCSVPLFLFQFKNK